MNQIEYEIERDNIELSYRQKLNKFDNQLRELNAADADLTIQKAVNQTTRQKIQAHRDAIDTQRKEELLKLKKEYLIKFKEQ